MKFISWAIDIDFQSNVEHDNNSFNGCIKFVSLIFS